MTRPDYVMIGGFLGAGKTTAIGAYAQWLAERGRRVGLITNDQSVGLVDTVLLGSRGFAVEEITGGCFCCRFNSLIEASERLTESTRPDVFIAEPVGSCTDLRASVSFPLSKIYGEQYRVAPLSVLVDPLRALRVLGLEDGPRFSEKVIYVYRKQLEEAESIVINKADLLDPDQLERLSQGLAATFPARQLVISAREGTGLDEWFAWIGRESLCEDTPPDVDYQIYAEGEARLGWYNATLRLSSTVPFDGNALLTELAKSIGESVGQTVAHLKMTLLPTQFGGDLGVIHLARSDASPELSHTLKEPLAEGQLTVNLRAEGDPEAAREVVRTVLDGCGPVATFEHEERFRPGKPEPTHRMSSR